MDANRIENWDVKGVFALMDYIESCHAYPNYCKREVVKKLNRYAIRWSISTGGLSANEDLISALLSNNMFRLMFYESWKRGGHYTFIIEHEAVGYMTVADYCKKHGVTRQAVSKNNKLQKIKLNKTYVR